MNLPTSIYVFRWFVRDTFRQANAARLSWLMLVFSGIFILICLSVGVRGEAPLERNGERADFLPAGDPLAAAVKSSNTGVVVVGGELTVFFGLIRVPLGRDAAESVHFLELLLAGFVADTLGIFLALIWTGGFFSSFLDPCSASVLLVKPVPRGLILVGKYVGVLAFVAAQVVIFVLGTWLALGLKTGCWRFEYLLCIPIFIVHFASFFAVSSFLAVRARSSIVCVLGSLAFWLICWGVNLSRHSVRVASEADAPSASVRVLAEAGYWMLPKPSDLSIVLFDALDAGRSFHRADVFRSLDRLSAFHPTLSLATSLLFALVALCASARHFAVQDY